MMNVATVHRNIVEGTDIVVNRDSDYSNDDSRGKEADRRQEESLPPRFRKSVFVHFSQPALRYDRREAPENRGDEDWQNPKASMGQEHGIIVPRKCTPSLAISQIFNSRQIVAINSNL
jgi:hypothetical protein